MKIERDTTKPGTWKVDGTISRRRIRQRGFKSKKAVEDFIHELRTQAKHKRFGLANERPPITVAALVEERVSELDLTTRNDRAKAKILWECLAALPENISLWEVKRAHIRDWVKELRKRAQPQSINRYLAEVSSMFQKAAAMFSALEEADWRPPKMPWEKVSKRGRERIISADERSALLEALRMPGLRKDGWHYPPKDITARRDVADCFELALLTGMRGIEVRSLEWSEVDVVEAEIHLPGHKTKTGEPRDVLLNTRAVEILRRRVESRTSLFIFPNEAGDGPRKEISRVVRPVAIALGLRYGRNISDGFSPHDTRHTATTEMLRRGHDLKTVQDVVGHTDKTMSLRYAHSTRESRRQAVESLGVLGPTRQKVDKGSSG